MSDSNEDRRDFAGRLVLVTGGAKGMGEVLTRHFAARGAHVIINHFHSRSEAKELAADITRNGGRCETVWASVAKPDHVKRMFAEIEDRHGALDVLVNNAAAGAFESLDTLDDVYWQRAFDTNTMGLLRCSLGAAPLMSGRPDPAIVSVSSEPVATARVVDGYAPAAATKAAADMLTRYLAVHLAPRGIRVNSVALGYLDSGALQRVMGDGLAERCDRATPRGRRASVDESAEACAFLATPQASAFVGQVLLADAGPSLLGSDLMNILLRSEFSESPAETLPAGERS